jgi:hypothetical protein
MVSVAPRKPGSPVTTGTPLKVMPLKVMRPVKAFEPAQKKPAGMGSLAKSRKVPPLAVVFHRSIPP